MEGELLDQRDPVTKTKIMKLLDLAAERSAEEGDPSVMASVANATYRYIAEDGKDNWDQASFRVKIGMVPDTDDDE